MFSEDYLTVVDNQKMMMAKMSPHLALAMCDHLTFQSLHSKWVLVITSSYRRNCAERWDNLSKLTLLVTWQTGTQSRQLAEYLFLLLGHTTSLRNSWANGDAHSVGGSLQMRLTESTNTCGKSKTQLCIKKIIISMLKKIKTFSKMISI